VELDLLTNLHATAATLGHWVPEPAHSDSKLAEEVEARGAVAAYGSGCSAIARPARDRFTGAGYASEDGDDDARNSDIVEVGRGVGVGVGEASAPLLPQFLCVEVSCGPRRGCASPFSRA
jgi:hypothetical protein